MFNPENVSWSKDVPGYFVIVADVLNLPSQIALTEQNYFNVGLSQEARITGIELILMDDDEGYSSYEVEIRVPLSKLNNQTPDQVREDIIVALREWIAELCKPFDDRERLAQSAQWG